MEHHNFRRLLCCEYHLCRYTSSNFRTRRRRRRRNLPQGDFEMRRGETRSWNIPQCTLVRWNAPFWVC